MQSVSESKQELEASIRYAENAISSAKATIESMEFRQEMAKKQYAEQTGREEALQREVAELRDIIDSMGDDSTGDSVTIKQLKDKLEKLHSDAPTMPVIPKAVAIAIFREGIQTGVDAACSELDGQSLMVEESDYVGNFEVSFTKEIDLEDELDLDWMRGKCGDYTEDAVIDALKGLCADKKFECRIHGVDDVEAKDSASS